MVKKLPFLLALLIFLTSATAVDFFAVRLSDVSALSVFLVLVLVNFYHAEKRSGIITIATLIFCYVLASFAFQFVFSATEAINTGMPNAIAIALGISTGILCLIRCDHDLILQVLKYYCRITLLVCWALYIHQVFWGPPGWINESEVVERFSALSYNPNQLALFLLPIPFFSILCYYNKIIGRSEMIFSILIILLLNLFVIGKALFVAWAFSLVFLFLNNWNFFGKTKFNFLLVVVKVMAISMLILAMRPILLLLYSGEMAGGQEDQGAIRLTLWENGVSAWFDAFLTGHGPGHYSGLNGPYENMEAHNFLIDWVSAYGTVGLALLLVFFILIALSIWRKSDKLMTAFLIALVVQMTFHFYARQPAFWMWWVFAFIASGTIVSGKARLNGKAV